ncbi:hypothetical protein CCP1ISM_1710002 [Azospirillaceae bacterium]
MENANKMLEYLISLGKVSREDVTTAQIANPTVAMMRAVDQIHTLCCNKMHPKECGYYTEEDGHPNPWERAEHIAWMADTIEIMEETEIDDEREFGATLNNMITMISGVKKSTLQILKIVMELNPEAFALSTSPSTLASLKAYSESPSE